mmetsp:Transcript_19041/g.32955  ORF Transcript_19041/g.32955 Transcript_19041/m.32955 type:complete len:195 (-) Transcript_19041:188-772(-)
MSSGPDRGGIKMFQQTTKTKVISFYGKKLIGQFGLWFCSLVSFAAMADSISFFGNSSCGGSCWYSLVVGIVSFLFCSFLLIMNYVSEGSRESSWFSQRLEMQLMLVTIVWWIPGVAFISNSQTLQSGVGIIFSWLALFFAIYSTYQAYNTWIDHEKLKKYDFVANQMRGQLSDEEDEEKGTGYESAVTGSEDEV